MTDDEQRPCAEHRAAYTYEVPATPEQVWEAIATAGGISAWMAPTRLDPQVGGQLSFDFGEFESGGVVTAYEPNRRFAYDEPWPVTDLEHLPAPMVAWFESIGVSLDDVRRDAAFLGPVATEFLIEAQSGGSCVIRIVTSSYGTGSDWENEFFAQMVGGWPSMLERLVAHLGGHIG